MKLGEPKETGSLPSPGSSVTSPSASTSTEPKSSPKTGKVSWRGSWSCL